MPEYKGSQFEGEVEQAKSKELTPDKLREKLRDPHFLPTHEQITKAFRSWDEWYQFCFDEERPIFEFFNEEYLNALADYFVGKIQEYGAGRERPLIILEVGAGNGRLSHFLQQKLNERAPDQTKVIATDPGKWRLKRDFPVEQLRHNEALEKYRPDIVIFSWMPYEEDYTEDFRKCASVQEYILIGETDRGCCGDEWKTWGWSWEEDDEGEKRVPPYEADGFERHNLDDLSLLQICRTDEPGRYFHSRTVSFIRRK